jgi:hypothetical protein
MSSTTVLVKAAYRDAAGGTGVAPSGVRLAVDGRDMTKQAKVSSSSLSVKLTGATAGKHTIRILVRDRAGNSRSATHAITVGTTSGSGSSSSSGTAAASGEQQAQTAAPSSGDYGSAGGGATATADAGDDLSQVLDPVEGGAPADAPVAAFPSADGGTQLEPGSVSSPLACGSSASPQATAGDQTGSDGQADGGRYALMLVGIGLVPVAVGFGIAGRHHRRWWEAIGKPPGRGKPPAGGSQKRVKGP